MINNESKINYSTPKTLQDLNALLIWHRMNHDNAYFVITKNKQILYFILDSLQPLNTLPVFPSHFISSSYLILSLFTSSFISVAAVSSVLVAISLLPASFSDTTVGSRATISDCSA